MRSDSAGSSALCVAGAVVAGRALMKICLRLMLFMLYLLRYRYDKPADNRSMLDP